MFELVARRKIQVDLAQAVLQTIKVSAASACSLAANSTVSGCQSVATSAGDLTFFDYPKPAFRADGNDWMTGSVAPAGCRLFLAHGQLSQGDENITMQVAAAELSCFSASTAIR